MIVPILSDDTLQQMNFEVLENSQYSPDLASLDCHMFGPLRDALGGRLFIGDKQVKVTMHAWLVRQPKIFL